MHCVEFSNDYRQLRR